MLLLITAVIAIIAAIFFATLWSRTRYDIRRLSDARSPAPIFD